MDKRFIYKRIVFKNKKEQTEFVQNLIYKSKKEFDDFAKLLSVSSRTLRDWRSGVTRLPFETVKGLSHQYKVRIPEIEKIVSFNEHLKIISSKGGRNNVLKNSTVGGNLEKRKIAWEKWWNSKGRFGSHPIINVRKSIYKIKKSKNLAEFIGIMLGDGGLSKYMVKITLNRNTDKKYIKFVSDLICQLFKIKPSIYTYLNDPIRKSVAVIQVSRVELVDYLKALGLIVGNKVKNQIEVPQWILNNKKYRIACLRGLIDTDGCFYKNIYSVNKKKYFYKKIAFTNRSIPLLQFVLDTLKDLNIKCVLTKGVDVRINSKTQVKRYLSIVGTNNPKHLEKFKI
ncbi:MAG: LAGLIDADG family homing endonuclease [Candidatus Paceibacterota bacterium]|jgi:hypothetical protein